MVTSTQQHVTITGNTVGFGVLFYTLYLPNILHNNGKPNTGHWTLDGK